MRLRRWLLVASVVPFIAVIGCESSSSSPSPAIDAGTGVFDSGSTPDGSPASSEAGGPDGSSGPAQLLCDKYGSPLLPFAGVPYQVQNQPSAASAPAPQGGTILDGIYVVTKNTTWGGGNGVSGNMTRSLLVLEKGAWFYRIEFDGVDDMRMASGFYTVDPVAKTVVWGDRECGGGGVPSSADEPLGYTATPTTFTTYLDKTATGGTTIKEIIFTKQ